MNLQGFEQLLNEKNYSQEKINQHIQIVSEYLEFLDAAQTTSSPPSASQEPLEFISFLKAGSRDTYENIAALARYGLYTQNRPLYLNALQLVDGGEVLGNLYDRLGRTAGIQKRDLVFDGIPLPSFGSQDAERPKIMKTVFDRMETILDDSILTSILSNCLRTLPDEWYTGAREKYLSCNNLDEYLDVKEHDYLTELEQVRNEGGLYFNQEITHEVIEFVRSQPEMSRGVRRRNVLFAAKIPYMAKEYLTENDRNMKRYYYCHCPWVRESIRAGKDTISPRFCQCSAGYEKKSWEVIFDQPLQALVVESVLKGDLRCLFAIQLPENVETVRWC